MSGQAAPVEGEAVESSSGPSRTAKRPQACLACRRIKHKCTPSVLGKQPCLRCHKKGQECMFSVEGVDSEWQDSVMKELGDLRQTVSDLQGLVKTLSTVASSLVPPARSVEPIAASQPVALDPTWMITAPGLSNHTNHERLPSTQNDIPSVPPIQRDLTPRAAPRPLPSTSNITASQPPYPTRSIDPISYDKDLAFIFASTDLPAHAHDTPQLESESTPRPPEGVVKSMGSLNGPTTDLLVMFFINNVAPHTVGLSLQVGKFPLAPEGLDKLNSYLSLVLNQLSAERIPAYHHLVRLIQTQTTVQNLLGDWVERYEHDPVLPEHKINPEEIVAMGLMGMYTLKRERTGHGLASFNLARAYVKANTVDLSAAGTTLAPLLSFSSTFSRCDGLRLILFSYISMIHSIVVVSRQVPPQIDITRYTEELYSLPDGPSFAPLILHARLCQILATCWEFPESPSSPLTPNTGFTNLQDKMGRLDASLDSCILDMQRWRVDSPMVIMVVCYVRMVISLLSNAEQRLPTVMEDVPSPKPQVASVAKQMVGIMDHVIKDVQVAFLPSIYIETTRQAAGVVLKQIMSSLEGGSLSSSELAANSDILAQVERIAMAFATSSLISDRLIHLHGRILAQTASQIRKQMPRVK